MNNTFENLKKSMEQQLNAVQKVESQIDEKLKYIQEKESELKMMEVLKAQIELDLKEAREELNKLYNTAVERKIMEPYDNKEELKDELKQELYNLQNRNIKLMTKKRKSKEDLREMEYIATRVNELAEKINSL